MKGKLEASMGGEMYITGLCTPLIAKRAAAVCALVVDKFDRQPFLSFLHCLPLYYIECRLLGFFYFHPSSHLAQRSYQR